MNLEAQDLAARTYGNTEMLAFAVLMLCMLATALGGGGQTIYAVRRAFRRSIQIRNEVDARSRAFCEKMRPLWLVQYYELRRIGLEAERRQRELRKTEMRTETTAYIVQLTHRF